MSGWRAGLAGRPVGELCGGQRQRVAIARALVSGPAVVFADEPTRALDPTTGSEVLRLLRRSVDRDGTTVVMVTHDPATAAWSDRLVPLHAGAVAADARTPLADEIAGGVRAVCADPMREVVAVGATLLIIATADDRDQQFVPGAGVVRGCRRPQPGPAASGRAAGPTAGGIGAVAADSVVVRASTLSGALVPLLIAVAFTLVKVVRHATSEHVHGVPDAAASVWLDTTGTAVYVTFAAVAAVNTLVMVLLARRRELAVQRLAGATLAARSRSSSARLWW
jgi:hypothetical protein